MSFENPLLQLRAQLRFIRDKVYYPKPDIYQLPQEVLHQQAARFGGRRWALFSDVNGTVDDPRRRPDQTLAPCLHEKSWLTVYSTGGDLSEVLKLVQNGRIPVPHIVVSELAGPIHILKPQSAIKPQTELCSTDFIQDQNFSRRLRKRFPREKVMGDVDSVIGRMNRDFADFYFGYRGIDKTQPGKDTSISRIRLEFTVTPGTPRKRIERFRGELQKHFDKQFPGLKVLIFQETDKDRKSGYHKVLLVPWGKEKAIIYLQKKLGINGAILAGDSDIDPLFDPSIGTDTWRVPVGKTLMAEAQMQQALHSRRVVEPIPSGTTVHRIYLHKNSNDWNPTIFLYDSARRSGSESVARAVRMADLAWEINRRNHYSQFDTAYIPAA